jgi:hypothetical protein
VAVFLRNAEGSRPATLEWNEDNPVKEVNGNIVRVCIESIAAQVVDAYAENNGIAVTDAIRLFMATKTYELLANPKSYLYLEAAPYVEEMLNAELSGDWESWMEV